MRALQEEWEKMREGGRRRIFLTVAGVLVGLLAIHRPVLWLAGRETAGIVTQAMHFVGEPPNRTDFSYRIRYQFAVDGEDYFGNTTRRHVRDVRRLPAVGTLIEVRYLPGVPFLNEPAQTELSRGLVVGSLGILLIGLSLTLGWQLATGRFRADRGARATTSLPAERPR